MRCAERTCLVEGRSRCVGPTALFGVATAELLSAGFVDDELRTSLERTLAFLRSLVRPDGSVAHFSASNVVRRNRADALRERPGRAGLCAAYDVFGREADRAISARLLAQTAGTGLVVFGSEYFFGSEHWTCLAAGGLGASAPAVVGELGSRWIAFLRRLQYGEGEAPWDNEGGYGARPGWLARVTPASSATEGAIATYELLGREHPQAVVLRGQIDRALGFVMRSQWRPGPEFAFEDPFGARGGVPSTQAELISRNDFHQHAGSALIRWADVLRRERQSSDRVPAPARGM